MVYDGKFAYSHHATDPVCGRLLNAFDIVRLHKFRELDENIGLDTPISKMPSYKAMSDLALQDDKVKAVFTEDRMAQASMEFQDDDWQKALELDHIRPAMANALPLQHLRNDRSLRRIHPQCHRTCTSHSFLSSHTVP